MNSSSSSPQALRSDIESTRRRIDDTMDALGNRLHGRHLVDEMVGALRQTSASADGEGIGQKLVHSAASASRSVAASVEKNPLPVLLIGAGVAWLAYKSMHHPDSESSSDGAESSGQWEDPFDAGHSNPQPGGLSQRTDGVADGVSALRSTGSDGTGAVGAVKEKLSHVGHEIGDRAATWAQSTGKIGSRISERARTVYANGRDAVAQVAEQKPIELGLGCLAAGLLAGLLIKTPTAVNRIAGAQVAGLKQKAQAKAQDLVSKGQEVASSGIQAAAAGAQGLMSNPQPAAETPFPA